jgi:hypothetical protein
VASFNRPGGNVTGVVFLCWHQAKQFGFAELVPHAVTDRDACQRNFLTPQMAVRAVPEVVHRFSMPAMTAS